MRAVTTLPTDPDAQLIIFRLQTTSPPLDYKKNKNKFSQLLAPSNGLPVSRALTFQNCKYIRTSHTLSNSIAHSSSTLCGELYQGLQIPWYYIHNATIKWNIFLPQLSPPPKKTMRTHQCQLGSPRRIRAWSVQTIQTQRSLQVTISVRLHYMAEWTPPLDLETPVHYRPKIHWFRYICNVRMR